MLARVLEGDRVVVAGHLDEDAASQIGNQVFVMGKGEGVLPRVTGEISARSDVGKPGVTLVTLDAAGERLGPLMVEFYQHLRTVGRRPASTP